MPRQFLVSACCLVPLIASQPLEIRFDTLPDTRAGGESRNFMGSAAEFPGSGWESQAQPVGNGRLGAMVFGNPLSERIQFNESSLWTGGANPSGGYEIGEFGSYQNFGDVFISMDGGGGEIEGYSRALDLRTGIHRTEWRRDGTTFRRDVFASKPDEVIVIRLSADQPERIRGRVRLAGAHGEETQTTGDSLQFAGSLPNGLRYAARMSAVCSGGTLEAADGGLAFGGGAVTLVLAAATDYALDPARGFRSGADPVAGAGARAAAAAAKSYDDLSSSHLADFGPLMARVELDVGAPPAGKPVTGRLEAYRAGGADPHLEALMFQYGRYLLASSSRGFLAANLQGLWNESNKPPWFADYHTNINLQMNYWLAEPANLAECARPLFDWTVAMIPGSREATRKAFGEDTPGWTMRTSVNIYGGNGWQWNLPASAWLARHFWEHYAFTGDEAFLKDVAWPVFSEVCEFWLDHLVEADGRLVVPKGWSPEHGPREDGVAHDQQIVWDLFTITLETARVIGDEVAAGGGGADSLVKRVAAAREKLLGPRIGSWGQLMEWTTERPELEKSGHRHTSHLYAVHPGNQITLHGTPDLARAAAVSLEARGSSGDSRRSWTWPWRTALWARLGRPDKAGEMIRGLLVHNTLPNLFTTHPPFQIDGNLGITAGIAETLVQSHAGEIAILPALPPAWPDGRFHGLLARGGFEVAAEWKQGSLVAAGLVSKLGAPAVLRLPGAATPVTVTDGAGTETTVAPQADGTIRFETRKGATYRLVPAGG